MKKFVTLASFLVCSFSVGAVETFYPDEIHGTLGLINNKANNSYGATLIMEDRTKHMSVLLREVNQIGPLIFKKDGKETVNYNAFVPKKITSAKWSFKSFGPTQQVFVNLTGQVKTRKEGTSTYYELVMYQGANSVEKDAFSEVWNLYVTAPRTVIEIEIDGSLMQLNFVR